MQRQIKKAIKILNDGGIIVFPTETVYGLGANAEDDAAVLKIFNIKKRPKFNPLICHFKNIKSVKKQALFTNDAKKLTEKFWPGPLTIILKKRNDSTISNIASSGLKTVACRIPSNQIVKKIFKNFNGIIAAPSANISSKLSATSKKHVLNNFGNKIYIIDGGKTVYGIESTVIDLTEKIPKILRYGAIDKEEIKKIIPKLSSNINSFKKITSPGQLKKHYSPNIPIRINVKSVKHDEVLLNFGKNKLKSRIKELNLSNKGSLKEAAKNFFDYLHILDKKKFNKIAVAPIKNKGIGVALNDRLKRAISNE